MSTGPYQGGCQCGAVRYTVPNQPIDSLCFCHCKACQRLSGSPFLTFWDVPTDAIKWSGSDPSAHASVHLSSFATRTFCNKCGSPITMTYHSDSNVTYLTAGSLDEEHAGALRVLLEGKGKREPCHIFVESAAPWADLTPLAEIKRFERFPTGSWWQGS